MKANKLPEPITDEMQLLFLRAQQGDPSCIGELQSLLRERCDIWQRMGDLAEHSELTMLNLVAGNNLLAKEAIMLKLAELKRELSTPSSSPLEMLLIRRIAVSWLQVHHADQDAAANIKAPGAQSVHAQKRLDSAHRRYLHAIRQLATVRRLMNQKVELPSRLQPKLQRQIRVVKNSGPVPRITASWSDTTMGANAG